MGLDLGRPGRPRPGNREKVASGGWLVACGPKLVETPQRAFSRAAVALATHHSPPTTYRRSPSSPTRREAPRSGLLPCGFNPTLVTPGKRPPRVVRRGSCLFYFRTPSLRHLRRTGVAGAIGDLVVANHPLPLSSSPTRRGAPRSGILAWLRVSSEPTYRFRQRRCFNRWLLIRTRQDSGSRGPRGPLVRNDGYRRYVVRSAWFVVGRSLKEEEPDVAGAAGSPPAFFRNLKNTKSRRFHVPPLSPTSYPLHRTPPSVIPDEARSAEIGDLMVAAGCE